jgi:hypothetical protein
MDVSEEQRLDPSKLDGFRRERQAEVGDGGVSGWKRGADDQMFPRAGSGSAPAGTTRSCSRTTLAAPGSGTIGRPVELAQTSVNSAPSNRMTAE